MSWYLVQAGSNLYKVDTSGTATQITLPTGVTIDSTKRMRAATLEIGKNEYVIAVVNSPSINLWIDKEGRTRPLCLKPLAAKPAMGGPTGSGSFSGAYKAVVTNCFRDVNGRLLQESPPGPESDSPTFSSAPALMCLGVDVDLDSVDTISTGIPGFRSRRVYRTTNGPGTVYYPWVEIEYMNASISNITDDQSDASLALLNELDSLGNPAGTEPGTSLINIVAWGGRFWAIPSTKVDSIVYTEENEFSKWPAANDIPIPPYQDTNGAVAFLPRRDMLGVARADSLDQVTIVNGVPRRVRIGENIGVIAAESAVTIMDRAYFLGRDGVYVWGPSGIENISRDKVHPWFTTDTYFNRSAFSRAQGWWDPDNEMYKLLLVSAGGSDLSAWIGYHIPSGAWFGPHSTGEFTPTGVALLKDANDQFMPTFTTSNGFLYKQNQSTRTDGTSTAITSVIETKYHFGDDPSWETFFGMPEVLTGIEGSGTLSVTPKVGELSASYSTTLSHALTSGRSRLNFRGNGRFLQLKLENAAAGVDFTVHGIEFPYHTVGRR